MSTPIMDLLEAEIERHPDRATALAARIAPLLPATPSAKTGWLNSGEAAAYLGCTRQRIHSLVHQKRLQARHEGRRLMFLPAWLDVIVEPSEDDR